MESLQQLEQIIRNFAPQVVIYGLMGLGTVVVLAGAWVSLTPGQDDDHWLSSLYSKPLIGGLLKLLSAFSPVSKVEGAVKLSNAVKKDG